MATYGSSDGGAASSDAIQWNMWNRGEDGGIEPLGVQASIAA